MDIIAPTDEEEKVINEGIKNDPDAPEWTDEMFARATRGPQIAPLKKQLSLRLDPDIVDWFKEKGRGYQTRMNEALREYIERQR